MFNGGVSFKGDPAKAAAALDEALQCANIVRILKAQSGLPAFTKQFDIKGGGVVTVSDLEYVKHIYIDVSIPGVETTTTSVREEPTKGYDIVPVALFASTDQPLGIYQAPPPPPPPPSPAPPPPETPSSPSSTVKSLSSWSNPPYAPVPPATPPAPPYDLAFAQGASSMIGNLDWSDRRPGGEFYGIVLTWWSTTRDSRYGSSELFMTFANEPQAYYGLYPFPDAAPTTIWANGVPLIDPGAPTECCALRSETQNDGSKKTFLVAVTPGGVVAKYELAIDVKNLEKPKTADPLPISNPVDFKYLQSSKASVVAATGLVIPGSVSLELNCSHINSSGTKMMAIIYGDNEVTYSEFFSTEQPFKLVVEYNLIDQATTVPYTVIRNFQESKTTRSGTSTYTSSISGYTATARPSVEFSQAVSGNALVRTLSPVNSPRNLTQSYTSSDQFEYDDRTEQIVALDYKGDTPVLLWIDSGEYVNETTTASSSVQVQETVDYTASFFTTFTDPNTGGVSASGGSFARMERQVVKTRTSATTWKLRLMHSVYGEISVLERPMPNTLNVNLTEISEITTTGGVLTTPLQFGQQNLGISYTAPIGSFGTGSYAGFFDTSAGSSRQAYNDMSRVHTKTLNGPEQEDTLYYYFEGMRAVACDLRADLYVLDISIYSDRVVRNNTRNNTYSAVGARVPTGNTTTQTINESTSARTTQYYWYLYTVRYDSVAAASAPVGAAEAGWSFRTEWSFQETAQSPATSISGVVSPSMPSGVPTQGNWLSPYSYDALSLSLTWTTGAVTVAPTSVSNTNDNEVFVETTYGRPGVASFFGHASSSFDGKLAFYSIVRMTPETAPLAADYYDVRYFINEVPTADLVENESALVVLSNKTKFDLTSPDYLPKDPKTGAQLLTGSLKGAVRFFLLGPLRNDKDGKYFTKPDGLSTV